ncbi:MAG: porin [Usitatibacter sp.]
MKRTLIAFMAAAGAAAAAMAQAEDAVTLYGRVYATFESVEAKGQLGSPGAAGACLAPSCAAPVVRRNRVADQASNLGVRGTEDLGRGIKAFFQLETQFKPDQNDTTFANRNSGVGLVGGFGQVLMGRWDTPFKDRNGEVDPFGDLTIGAFTTALQGSGVAGASGQFDRRDQNVVQYWTPNVLGFEARFSYSANEARTAASNPQSQGASITWARGTAFAGYSYHELKDQPFGVFTNTAPAQPAVLAIGSVNVGKQAAHSVFGSLKVGPVTLSADYQEYRRTSPSLPAAMSPGTVVAFDKQKSWMAAVVWATGAHRLIYEYTATKGGGQQAFDARYTPQSPECDVSAIGYQYDFSRRTFLLAQYVRVNNNATATCNFGFNTIAIAPGQEPVGYSLGVRHIF